MGFSGLNTYTTLTKCKEQYDLLQQNPSLVSGFNLFANIEEGRDAKFEGSEALDGYWTHPVVGEEINTF